MFVRRLELQDCRPRMLIGLDRERIDTDTDMGTFFCSCVYYYIYKPNNNNKYPSAMYVRMLDGYFLLFLGLYLSLCLNHSLGNTVQN